MELLQRRAVVKLVVNPHWESIQLDLSFQYSLTSSINERLLLRMDIVRDLCGTVSRILFLSGKQIKKAVWAEGVNSCVYGLERPINGLYGAWPKIWSNWPVYRLTSWPILADALHSYERVRVSITLCDPQRRFFPLMAVSLSFLRPVPLPRQPNIALFLFFPPSLPLAPAISTSIFSSPFFALFPCLPACTPPPSPQRGPLQPLPVQWEVTHGAYCQAG